MVLLFVFLHNAFGHANSSCRTDETTEVTAYALRADQTGTAGLVIEYNGLMAAVATGYLTASTADTQLLVELRIDDGVAIQMVELQELL